MSQILSDLMDAAHIAGEIQRAAFNSVLTIEDKNGGKGTPDLVSRVDHESEDAIRKALSRYTVVGEEQGGTPGDKYVLVDPLDGTKNFLCGFAHFAVCLTYLEKDTVKAAVVYDPVAEKMFTAEDGRAELNGVSISVRTAPLRQTFFLSEENLARWNPLLRIKRAASHFAGVRKMGSTALDLALMAAGQSAALVATGLKPWDFQGAGFIYEQAGGKISELNGGPVCMQSDTLVAASPDIHPFLVNKIRPGLFQTTFANSCAPTGSVLGDANAVRMHHLISCNGVGPFI